MTQRRRRETVTETGVERAGDGWGPAVCRYVTAVRGAVPSRQVHIAGFLSLTRRIGRQHTPRVFSKYTLRARRTP